MDVIYPKITVEKKGKMTKFTTYIRKKHFDNWYLGRVSMEILHVEKVEEIMTEEWERFVKTVYVMATFGAVDLKALDGETNEPVWLKDMFQEPEEVRLTKQPYRDTFIRADYEQ